MPPRRRGLDIMDEAVETAVGAFADRAAAWFEKLREAQPQPRPGVVYTCRGCEQPRVCAFVSPETNPNAPTYGMGFCEQCMAFVWQAAKEKTSFLMKQQEKARARAAAAGQAPPRQQPPPVERRKPWDVLGIAHDASVEEIKKAYRKVAAACHPDLVPPGAPDGERERMRSLFEECGRAKDVMLKLRQVVT